MSLTPVLALSSAEKATQWVPAALERRVAVGLKAPQRSEYSWTALISKNTRNGQGKQALRIYGEMRKDGVDPSPHTLVALLKACGRLRDLASVKQIHADVVRSGLESHLYVGTMLVDAYAKCGSLVDARDAFEKVPRRDVVSWTALIFGYSQTGQGEQALQLYAQMQREGVVPNDRTYVGALKACSAIVESAERSEGGCRGVKEECLEIVRGIHRDVVKGKFESVVYVGTMLVDVYAKCGSLEDARVVFEKMPHRTVVTWNAITLGYAQTGKGDEALQLFDRMQREGVAPDDRTYVGALKACSTMAELARRREGDDVAVKEMFLLAVRSIHAEVVKNKFDSGVVVGNILLDAYAKCGSLDDARCVFEKMAHHDIVSWTAMISAYARMNKGEAALQLYRRMQEEGVAPDGQTYVCALKACSSLAESAERNECGGSTVKERCLETVRSIHAQIFKGGQFASVMFVGTTLVDAYIKCGSLEDARCVFEKMPHRDVVSWNAMMLGYAQADKGEHALQLYAWMQQEGVLLDGRTYASALKACSRVAESVRSGGDDLAVKDRCLETVRAIHTDIVKANFESGLYIGNMLVDTYAKCGSLDHAREVFENIPDRTVASWNAMIFGYAQMDRGEEALALFTRMQTEDVVPDARTYVGALKACSSLAESEEASRSDGIAMKEKCLKTVRAIDADIVNAKFDQDVFVSNILVDVYAKCGSLEDASSVFEKIPQRDVVSWNAIISGYSQMDKGEEALQLYNRMQLENVVPDGRTYVAALRACVSLAELGVEDEGDGTAVKERCLETVRTIHAKVEEGGFKPNFFVETMLVNVYAKCGNLEDARHVFEKMSYRDVISWTAMVLAYAQKDKGEEALQLYTRMQTEGVKPDARTYVGALNACGSVAGLEKGKEIHAQILKAELEILESFVPDSLIHMYGRCGSMVDAQKVFDAMTTRETGAWNALIAGYAHQGESELVFELFHKMKQEGVHPNSTTFLGVLTVCSHVGLVDSGQNYFIAMSRDYGISPSIKHFTCIIDLFGRAGHVDKAMEMLKTMPFQPNSAVWRCMLSACQKWGDVEVGRQAFEHAQRLNHDDAAAYVLMSNIYAAADMREKAKELQAMRLKSGAWKQPGQSQWTDSSGTAHMFVVGDQGHPESQHIFSELAILLMKMRKHVYVPTLAVLDCWGVLVQPSF